MLLRSAKLIQVVLHTLFHGPELYIASGLAQLRQVRLRETLVSALQVFGKRDVPNLALTVPLDYSIATSLKLCAAPDPVL